MRKCLLVGYGFVLATWGSLTCPELANTHGYSWFFVFTRKRAAAASYRTCDFGPSSTTHSHRGGSLEVLYATESTIRYEFAYDMAFL